MFLFPYAIAALGAVGLSFVGIRHLGRNNHWTKFEQSENGKVPNPKTVNLLYGIYIVSLCCMLVAAVVVTVGLYVMDLIPFEGIFTSIVVLDVTIVLFGYLLLSMMRLEQLIATESLKEYEGIGMVQFAAMLLIALGVNIIAGFARLLVPGLF